MQRVFLCVVAIALLAGVRTTAAQSNVNPDHKHAWGETVGWTNWRDAGEAVDGVIVDEEYLSGYVWCENVGWINVGNGAGPYSNNDDTDFGVNIEPGGDLSGYAWGENIGWVNFDTDSVAPNQARYDAEARRLRGYAWAENVGWVNLDDATHFVATIELAIPTMSEWGLLAMTLLILVAGTVLFRRGQRAAAAR